MEIIPWIAGSLIVFGCNYAAGRAERLVTGKVVFLASILPALAVVAFYGVRLAYAVLHRDEVNRRFEAGDLTYFGADMAFGIIVIAATGWILLAGLGFWLGRTRRASV